MGYIGVGGSWWGRVGWGGVGEIIDVTPTSARCRMMPIVIFMSIHKVLVGVGWVMQGVGVGHIGMGHVGVGVSYAGLGWVMQGGVGHTGVEWVIKW